MRIAMVGTRGVPARYGGFETAVEEIGRRLTERGHDVVVYCRTDGPPPGRSHLGMELVELPALRRKSLETLSHTFLSSIDSLRRAPFDVVFLFNAANAPFVPILRRRGSRVAIHVDGLESRRTKWGRFGRAYYRFAEGLSARWGDALIADAEAIGRYFEREFGAASTFIAYGAPLLDDMGTERLTGFGVEPGKFHLVVARFEPENHVDMIVDGYRDSDATWPLVVVGGAPYAHGHVRAIHDVADDDDRIRLVGSIWDQEQLDQLYRHAGTYLHGHSVGGTNPSLLRAMGAGAPVCSFDVEFTREVLGDTGVYFDDPASVRAAVENAEADPSAARRRGVAARDRAAANYRWDDVADGYERLAEELTEGLSHRKAVSGRRKTPR